MLFIKSVYELLKLSPILVKLVVEMVAWMKATFGDDPAKFLADMSDAFEKGKGAQTPQERRHAAAQIAHVLKRL